MKILAITDAPDLPEVHLLLGLVAAGYSVTLIHSPQATTLLPLQNSKIQFVPLEIGSRLNLGAIFKIRQLLKSSNFEVVHSFTARALSNALIASIGFAVKHVAYRGTVGHLSRWDPASWLSFLNPRVSAISCVSNAVRDYLISLGLSASKAHTIYKGHDVQWYDSASEFDLKTLGIPDGSFVIGYVANMRPVKGADILLEAAKLLLQNGGSLHFILIGDIRHDRVTQLLNELATTGKVHHLARRPDAVAIMKRVSAFVMPSRAREGLPKAVIEAMSCGITPIVSRVGGMPELVEDGVSGLVVEPSSPKALAEAISKLANDSGLLHQLGKAARSRIIEKFNIAHTVTETIKLYNAGKSGN